MDFDINSTVLVLVCLHLLAAPAVERDFSVHGCDRQIFKEKEQKGKFKDVRNAKGMHAWMFLGQITHGNCGGTPFPLRMSLGEDRTCCSGRGGHGVAGLLFVPSPPHGVAIANRPQKKWCRYLYKMIRYED